MIQDPILEICIAFEKDLVADGKAKKTIISYVGDVREFLKWLNNKGVVFEGNISRFYITQYKDYLIENKYAIETINKKVNSLSSFNYFQEQGGKNSGTGTLTLICLRYML